MNKGINAIYEELFTIVNRCKNHDCCNDVMTAEKIKGVNRVEYAFFIILFVGMITLVKGFTQPVFFIPSVLLFIGAYFVYRKDEKRSVEREKKIEYLKQKYRDFFALPDSDQVYKTAYIEGMPSVDSSIKQVGELLEDVGLTLGEPRLYMWTEGDNLKYLLSLLHDDFLFPNLHQLDYVEDGLSTLAGNNIKIPSGDIRFDDILLFGRFGDLYVEAEGGEYRLGKAITEGIVAGEVPPVVGSREEIVGEEKGEDKTVLIYRDGGGILSVNFGSGDFDMFQKLIPDKELTVLIAARKIQEKMINEKTDIPQRIEKLNDLKSKGLITEEEFCERKKLLLDKLTE